MTKKAANMELRLRRKFTLAAMLAVTAVLVIIMAAINIGNYMSVCNVADARLDFIVENGGSFANMGGNTPELLSEDDAAAEEAVADGADADAAFSVSPAQAGEDGAAAEDPSGTDNYTLKGEPGTDEPSADDPGTKAAAAREMNGMGPGISAETPYDTRFFSVTYDKSGNVIDADLDHIAAVDESSAESMAAGLRAQSKQKGFVDCYRYQAVKADDGSTMYVFVDCNRELENFQNFLLWSVLIAAAGWLAVLVLVVVLSGRVVKPVVEAYTKQQRFITDASHELKTPLAVIGADIEVQEIESGETEWTESMREQVGRMGSLVERLVFLARMDEGANNLTMADLDLSQLVRETAEPFEGVAQARRMTLHLDIEEGISFKGDANALKQAVELLLDNATRYATPDTTIDFSLKRTGKQIELVETNQVDELPSGDLNKLFERFYRADTSRNKETGGTGVGLSVVKAIAEAHGGTAECKGKGNQISFVLKL